MTNEEMRKAILGIKRYCLGNVCGKKCPAYKSNDGVHWYCSIRSPWTWGIEARYGDEE